MNFDTLKVIGKVDKAKTIKQSLEILEAELEKARALLQENGYNFDKDGNIEDLYYSIDEMIPENQVAKFYSEVHFIYKMYSRLIEYKDFQKVEMHTGEIIEVKSFPNAIKPSYQLKIDFGNKIGKKFSSAQITDYYAPDDLLGKQIIAVTNFKKKQIANFFSEVLVLGAEEEDGKIIMLTTERKTKNGLKIC